MNSKWQKDFQVRPEDRLHAQKSSLFDIRFLKKYVAIFAAIILGIIILWYMLGSKTPPSNQELPVLKAPSGPYKIKPDTQESDQQSIHSKTIYEKLAAKKPDEKVEHLLQEPEEPIATPPSLPEDFIGNLMNDESLDEMTPALKSDERSEQVSEKDHLQEKSLNIKISDPESVKSLPEPPESSEKQSSLAVTSSSIKAKKFTTPTYTTKEGQMGTHWVQLASLRSKDAAEREWKRLSSLSRLKPLLGNFKPVYGRVDMGESEGIRYRLRVGLLSYEGAKDLCAKLKEHKVDCIVKKNQ